jgi:hypothetical protein
MLVMCTEVVEAVFKMPSGRAMTRSLSSISAAPGPTDKLAQENAELKRVNERLRQELRTRDERERRLLETIEKQNRMIQALQSIKTVDDGNLCVRLLPPANSNM